MLSAQHTRRPCGGHVGRPYSSAARRAGSRFRGCPRSEAADTARELERAGIDASPELVLADAGYWHHIRIERLVSDGMAVLVPPDAKKRG